MQKISEARKICAAVLLEFYPKADLMADMLDASGGYRGFWMTPGKTVLETRTDNVFDGQALTEIYELKYRHPIGWPIAS